MTRMLSVCLVLVIAIPSIAQDAAAPDPYGAERDVSFRIIWSR